MKRLTRALSLWLAVFLVAGSLYVPAFASETEEGQENAVTVVDGIGLNEEGNSSEDQYVEENNSVDNDLQETAEVENVEQETGAPEIPADSASESVEVNPSEQEVQPSEEESGNSNQNLIEQVPSETVENNEQGGSDTGTEAVVVPAPLPEQENVPADDSIVEPGITEEIPAAVPANDSLEGDPLEDAVELDMEQTFSGTLTDEGETSHYYSFTPSSDGRYSFSLESEEAVYARLYETSIDTTCLYDSSTAEEGPEFCRELRGGVTYYLQVWKNANVEQAAYSLTVRQIFYLTLNATDGYYTEQQLDENSQEIEVTSKEYTIEVESGSNFFDLNIEESPTAPEGTQFAGWSESEGGDLLYADTPYYITSDTMLYAVWSREEVSIDAQDLTLGDYLSNTAENDEVQYYRFVPDETGYYKFFSEKESGDPKATLYRGPLEEHIDEDDDGAGENNFRIFQELQAGQEYYLAVQNLSEEECSYSVCVVKSDIVNVTYHANGGYFYEDDEDVTLIYEKGSVLQGNSEPIPSHTDSAKAFTGWSKSEDGDVFDTLTLENGVDLYAKWGDRCTITFDAGEGYFNDEYYDFETGELVTDAVKTRSEDVFAGANFFDYEFTEPLAPAGKTFAGWSQEKDGSKLESIDPFIINSDVTLYAVWDKAYTVTFNAGDGYFDGDPTQKTYTKVYAEGALFWNGLPAYPEYENGSKVCNNWVTQDGEPIALDYTVQEDITVYAKWENTIEITFNANGGYFTQEGEDGETTTEESCSARKAEGYIFDYGDFEWPKYEDDSRIFGGWSKSPSGGVVFQEETQVNNDLVLYAIWNPAVQLTFDANGGYFELPDDLDIPGIRTERVRQGSTYSAYNYVQPQADGLNVFKGWSTSKDGDLLEDDTEITQDLYLYAVWEEGVIVTYDANGGLFDWNQDVEQVEWKYHKGDYIENGEGPSMSHEDESLMCTGWSLTPDGEPIEGMHLSESITLYAVWKPAVTITYDAGDDGYFNNDKDDKTTEERVVKGTEISCDAGPSADTDAENLVFGGWSETKGGELLPDHYVVDTDITLHPVWIPAVTVTFDANGGCYEGDSDKQSYTEKLAKGSDIYDRGDTPRSPQGSGMVFGGYSWTINGEPVSEGETVTENTTLYAVWLEPCTVTFHANGGTFVDGYDAVSGESFDEAETFTRVLGKGATLASDDYIHDNNHKGEQIQAGWSQSADGPVISPDGITVNQDMSLYAVWGDLCEITFDANGGYFDSYNEETYTDEKVGTHVMSFAAGRNFSIVDYDPIIDYPKENSEFLGWSTSRTGAPITDDVYTVNENATLYAVWGTTGWNQFAGGWKYYVDSEKGFYKSEWAEIDGKQYYFNGTEYRVTGLQTIEGKKYYFNADGVMQTGLQTIEGKKYYFGEDGVMQTGWQTIGGKKHYFDGNGAMQTGLQTIGGKKYYFDGNGVMLTGWQTIGGKKHYFDGNGVMQNGLQTIGGKKYYFDGNGVMLTGWQTIGGKKHYFDGNGVMLTGLQTIGGKKYYFDGNGVMLTGWQTIGGKKHYFDGNGVMLTGLQTIGGKKYYFDGNGVMLTGWQTIGGKKHYFDGNGVMQTGLQTIGGKKHYFDGNGVMQTGWQTIGGKKHYFDGNGVMQTGLQTIGGKKYYFDGNGAMQTGWQTIGGKKHYFDGNGVMLTGWQKISNKWYYFNGNGVMLTGWQKISNKWYYFNGSGAMLTGWQKISNKWYYFNGSGAMLTGWQKISSKWYYFNGSGAMLTGWQKISSKWYYFNGSGAMLTGWQKISGKYYYFDGSGAMVSNKWVGNYYLTSSGVMATNTWIGNYYVDGTGKWVKSR